MSAQHPRGTRLEAEAKARQAQAQAQAAMQSLFPGTGATGQQRSWQYGVAGPAGGQIQSAPSNGLAYTGQTYQGLAGNPNARYANGGGAGYTPGYIPDYTSLSGSQPAYNAGPLGYSTPGAQGQPRWNRAPEGSLPINVPSFVNPNQYGPVMDYLARQTEANVNATNASTTQPTTQQSGTNPLQWLFDMFTPKSKSEAASTTTYTKAAADGAAKGSMPTSTGGGFMNPNASLNREQAATPNLSFWPLIGAAASIFAPGSGGKIQNVINSLIGGQQADSEAARQKEYDAATREQTAQGMAMYQQLQGMIPQYYKGLNQQLGQQTANLQKTQQGAFQDMYGNTMSRYDQRTGDVMGLLTDYGKKAEKDTRRDFAQSQASSLQDLQSRGLGASTINANVRQGNARAQSDALEGVRERVDTTKAGMLSDLTGQAASANASLLGQNYGDVMGIGQGYMNSLLGLNADEANAMLGNYRDAITFLGGINHLPPSNNAISQWQQFMQGDIESRRMADAQRDAARYGMWGSLGGAGVGAVGSIGGGAMQGAGAAGGWKPYLGL